LDIFYWNNVKKLLQILEWLYEAQIMNEFSKNNLSYIYSRWEKIEAYLIFQNEFTDFLSIYAERFEKQISEIHFMVFHLNPANQAAPYKNTGKLNKFIIFLKNHQDPEKYIQTKLQLLYYKTRRRGFAAEKL
jgi:hypothetical protein